MEKRTRQTREPLPLTALVVQGDVDPGQVPQARRQIGQRKWHSLAQDILDRSRRGRWLVVTLTEGDPDVVRSGLKEELKRDHARLEWRLARHDNGSSTLYFFAKLEESHAT